MNPNDSNITEALEQQLVSSEWIPKEWKEVVANDMQVIIRSRYLC